jgi:uncharacterized protein (DUF849 family)
MSNAIWLEAALNGPWSRNLQPRIPITPDEIVDNAVACAEAGASILHFHAYDVETGKQKDNYDIYAPIIERIRKQTDAICYPTIPFTGGPDASSSLTPPQRFAAVEQLAQAGLIEWSAVDPGSTNISQYADIVRGKEGFIYTNPESDIRYGLKLGGKYGIVPSYAIYEPGFMRLGAALSAVYPEAPKPIFRLMFSDKISFGFPPTEWALDAYLKLLKSEMPEAQWMIAGLSVCIESLIAPAVTRGGHIRVGLEDAPFGCSQDNLELTKRAVKQIQNLGYHVGAADEIREILQAKVK